MTKSHQEMALELTLAGWKVKPPKDQNNCLHKNSTSFGYCSSDGSGDMTYNCPDCGKSWRHITERSIFADHDKKRDIIR